MSTTLMTRELRVLRSARECAEQCDVARARRMEPTRRIDRMTREQQASFWRRVPLLSNWVGSWRESRR